MTLALLLPQKMLSQNITQYYLQVGLEFDKNTFV